MTKFLGTVSADSLADTQCGGVSNLGIGYRFTLPQTLEITSIGLFFITPDDQQLQGKTGYAGGMGGEFTIHLFDPSGTELAVSEWSQQQVYPVVPLSKAVTLSAGVQYLLKITNVDASPTINFSAVDSLFSYAPQFTFPGCSVEYYYNGTTIVRSGYLPIMSLLGPAGTFSLGWMEVETTKTEAWSKEVITTPVALSIAAVNVRPCAPLVNSKSAVQMGWSRQAYATPWEIAAGETFEVIVQSPCFPIRKGTQQGFPDPMPGWHGEYSADGKIWAPLTVPTDIAIVFELA